MRRVASSVICALLICGLHGLAHGLTGVIYQPQLRDMTVSDSFWSRSFKSLRQQGFDTLVVQWTRHGDSFSSGAPRDWLDRRVQDALEANLNIVVGLYADPDVFPALEVSSDLLEPYFLRSTEANVQLAQSWISKIPKDRLSGWYLPLEIDDRRWRSANDASTLSRLLGRDIRELERLIDKPVYISAFFKGNSSPAQFKVLLESISKATSLKIWVQDGRGTGVLSPPETSLYLASLLTCHDSPVSGVVYEIFRQTGPDHAFKAEPLSARSMASALRQRSPCGGDTVFFSFRYLMPLGN